MAETIAHVGSLLEPGVTTDELDAAADAFIRGRGGLPTSAGYKGYPKAICISANEVVVHGIPGPYAVAEGDLVTIDVGVTLDAYIADSAYTFGVGEIDPEAQRLLDVAQEALAAGIAEARHGNRVGDIAHAVQTVVEDGGLLGRAQPRRPWRRPLLPRGPAHPELRRARPRPTALRGDDHRHRADDHGRRPGHHVADDGWTISTADGSLSAHFEHTVAILPEGPRILTPRVGLPAERTLLR